MNVQITSRYQRVIDEIRNFNWRGLKREELMIACRAYYYFSRQFVDAVHIACDLYPSDENLISLREGECDTDNLSPYPGIAEKGEKMNHDEFMRRVVESASLDQTARERVDNLGREYLAEVSRRDPLIGMSPRLGRSNISWSNISSWTPARDRTDPCAGTSLQTIGSFHCGRRSEICLSPPPPVSALKTASALTQARGSSAPEALSARRVCSQTERPAVVRQAG
jgi:hypothetical protein